MKLTEGIGNIIFDLGNVIIDIAPQQTIQSFKNMGFTGVETFLGHSRSMGFMASFQEGKIGEGEFFDEVRFHSGLDLSNTDIAKAWNAMLLHYDTKRIDRLMELKDKFRLFLFSNTNVVHFRDFSKRVPGLSDIALLFEHTYYSHEIGLSKPNPLAYKHVLAQAGLKASETLFLDDLPENVSAAANVGMKAQLVEYPNQWLEWLD